MRERGRENLERGERMNRRKTHRKLPSESIPVKIMQRDFLGREKRMWVAGVPFFIKKSENPQGTTLRMICEEVWPRPQPEGGEEETTPKRQKEKAVKERRRSNGTDNE